MTYDQICLTTIHNQPILALLDQQTGVQMSISLRGGVYLNLEPDGRKNYHSFLTPSTALHFNTNLSFNNFDQLSLF